MPLGSAFKITSDNPVGRQQIEHGYVTHNKFICNAAPYTECHQSLSSVSHSGRGGMTQRESQSQRK